MIIELTIQIRVSDFQRGLLWYQLLLDREPDFIPHEGFAEWELIPGSWLQVAEGIPAKGSGPVRLGVQSITEMLKKLERDYSIGDIEVHTREEVPVKWCTFSDPWGNQLGLFEYLNKEEEMKCMSRIHGQLN
ncbi:VOC family protein [Ornithinibacillus scapharcae]|uniref:VOC family protein n=1 Tax=Ornithinibacillus scapharcae TaxID=1147159 RepID=UPI000225C0EF|nr:glyoxalase/bleomycin resistance/dioxygenase family protein [Ornithinibacillus scapharcae]